MSCPSKQTRLEKMAIFCSTGKLHCSPSREERPVRPKSRRATTGSLLNSPVEESAPEVSGTISNVLSIFFLICYLGNFSMYVLLNRSVVSLLWKIERLWHCIIVDCIMPILWFYETRVYIDFCVNPLTPNGDQRQISPYNITPESHIDVTRIREMTTNKESYRLFNKFSFSEP